MATDETFGFKASGNKLKYDPDLVHKGKMLMEHIMNFLGSHDARVFKGTVGIVKLNKELLKLPKVAGNIKKEGIIITSVVLRKALLAAGISTSDEATKCLQALGNLASDFGSAAALGPETLGIGALLPLASAAIDAYDVGNCCFSVDGQTTHAVSDKKLLKQALSSSKHGQI